MNDEARPRVLFVDDEDHNLATLRRVFRRDYEMSFAASVAEAIELIRTQRFDVAFVDYAMLGMSGLELLSAADEIQPLMGRVMLTAHADLAEVALANAIGLSAAVLSKPWSRGVIRGWVEHFRAQASARRTMQRMALLSAASAGPRSESEG